MTVGEMVGGRGYDWGSLFLPTTHRPTKVIAGEDLPKGASATFLLTEAKKITLDQEKFKTSPDSEAILKEIFFRGHHQLSVPGVSAPAWISSLPFAEDVHSEVARLSVTPEVFLSHKASIVFTLTKAVKKGETLAFWFSSEMASELGMPFLNFSHVKDGCYICPSCTKSFRTPNPLKLHLATACDTLGSGFLWSRLWNSFSSIYIPWETPRLTPRKKEMKGDGKCSYNTNTTNLRQMSPPTSKTSVGHHFIPYTLPRNLFQNEIDTKSVSPDSTSIDQNESSFHKDSPKPRDHSDSSSQKRPKDTLTMHSSSAFKPVIGSSQELKKSRLLRGEITSLYSQSNRKNLFSNQNSLLSLPFTQSRHFVPLVTPLPDNPLLTNAPTSSNLLQWSHISPTSSHAFLPHHLIPLATSSSSVLNPLPSTSSVDPCADVETFVSSLGRGKGSHLCLYCGKVYSRKYGLKIHIRTHTGYKPLKCRVCLRPFGDPSNLNKHIRLHAQGETPYRCDLCGKVLVRKRDLDRHLRSRHPKAILPKLGTPENLNNCPKDPVLKTQGDTEHCDQSITLRTSSENLQAEQDRKDDLKFTYEERGSKEEVEEEEEVVVEVEEEVEEVVEVEEEVEEVVEVEIGDVNGQRTPETGEENKTQYNKL